MDFYERLDEIANMVYATLKLFVPGCQRINSREMTKFQAIIGRVSYITVGIEGWYDFRKRPHCSVRFVCPNSGPTRDIINKYVEVDDIEILEEVIYKNVAELTNFEDYEVAERTRT